MTPFNLPLTITKGITFGPVTFNFQQADASPFDLTNYKVFAHARRTKYAKEKIDLNPQITDAVNGTVVMQFTDEQTAVFMGGENNWDLILEAPAGARLGPYFAGKLLIKEINTHA